MGKRRHGRWVWQISALVAGTFAGAASAQPAPGAPAGAPAAPPAPATAAAPAPATPAPPPTVAAPTSEKPGPPGVTFHVQPPDTPAVKEAEAEAAAEASHRKLAVTVGGGLLHSSDENEASGDRGAVAVGVAFRPGGSLRGLEIAAGYEDLVGPWEYLQKNPSLEGGGAARAQVTEQRHLIGLDVRYDVLRLIRKGLPVHASPLLGLAFVSIDSPVYRSTMFGGGGGVALAVDLDPRTIVDASFAVVRGFVSGGGEGSLFGSVTGVWSWGTGVSMGATEWSRIRLGYVGEALDRQATTRFTNGARLSFLVSFL